MRRHPAFDKDAKSLAKTRCRSIEKDIAAFARLLESGHPGQEGDEYPLFKPALIYKARAISRDVRAGKSGALRVILERREDEWIFLAIYMHNQQGSDEQDLRAEIARRLKMEY